MRARRRVVERPAQPRADDDAFPAIVLSATVLAKADALLGRRALWGGARTGFGGVIAFATSPPAMKERRPVAQGDGATPSPKKTA